MAAPLVAEHRPHLPRPARYRLIFHPTIEADLKALDDQGLDAALAILDDLAHGRVTGRLLGQRHVSGDLTGLARIKFDIPDYRPPGSGWSTAQAPTTTPSTSSPSARASTTPSTEPRSAGSHRHALPSTTPTRPTSSPDQPASARENQTRGHPMSTATLPTSAMALSFRRAGPPGWPAPTGAPAAVDVRAASTPRRPASPRLRRARPTGRSARPADRTAADRRRRRRTPRTG